MELIWKKIFVFCFLYPFVTSSESIDSLLLNLIHRNISDFESFNNLYQSLLIDVQQHRSTNIVSSPVDVEKIRSNNYDINYLEKSCYETASDLLSAHGYNKTDLKLSTNDLKLLLPAVLNIVQNPGCKRNLPPVKPPSFFDIWILGLILIVIMKLIHIVIFFLGANYLSALTSSGISKLASHHAEPNQNSKDEVHFPPVKYQLWLGLGFNAFTCGIILGTVIYHLIPQIYGVPNEEFDYMYLLRGTIVLCGIFLFFTVEKVLRFRFKIDEAPLAEPVDDFNEAEEALDTTMVQLTHIQGLIHAQNHNHNDQADSPVQLTSNIDEQISSETNPLSVQNGRRTSDHHHHNHPNDIPSTRNHILYHIIHDFSNDIIYGCGLSTALGNDYLTAIILWILIFSEGLRRHSQLLLVVGKKHGVILIVLSMLFLVIGYVIGASLIQFAQPDYFRKEYVYSVVYGALFYTALVTLMPELNDFSQHLQVAGKTVNQTVTQRRSLKFSIFLCQNLFLIIGVLISLIIAIIWRYYHRQHIAAYICKRDPFRPFCSSST